MECMNLKHHAEESVAKALQRYLKVNYKHTKKVQRRTN